MLLYHLSKLIYRKKTTSSYIDTNAFIFILIWNLLHLFFQAIFHQQNSVLLPSPDEFETSEVQDDLEIMESMNPDEIHSDVDLVIMDSASQEKTYSNHSETVSEIMDPGPEIYTNYINIMPDNDLPEPDDQGHQEDSEVM